MNWANILTKKLTRATLSLTLLGVASLAHGEALTFAADNWLPYTGNPQSDKPGYAVELLKEIFGKDYTVDYKLMPWVKAIGECNKNNVVGIIGAIHSDAPNFVYPKDCIGLSSTVIITLPTTPWKYTGPESLKNKKLGIVEGYSYGKNLDAYIHQNKGNTALLNEIQSEAPELVAIKLLQDKAIDAYAADPVVLAASLKEAGLPLDALEVAGVADTPEPIYVAFSPHNENSKALAQKFSEGIEALRKSGQLKNLLARYGVNDWQK